MPTSKPASQNDAVTSIRSLYQGGGFVNPYARAVEPAGTTCPTTAPVSQNEAATSSLHRYQGGGFVNPYARAVELASLTKNTRGEVKTM
jgi:hypothetical protein